MKTTLVVMAAGIGSRFGGGVKQLAPVGPNGEIIIEYSMFDAKNAGFDRIVFIIRHDIENDFEEAIGGKAEKVFGKENVFYAYQETNIIPKDKAELALTRTKPWGTGHAILICRGLINTPFAVINADDYYGKEAYILLHQQLTKQETAENEFCMAGFVLKNTLSENGGVTRGVCISDENNYLIDIDETKNIESDNGNGKVGDRIIDGNSLVSMNMWGYKPNYIDMLEDGFNKFLNSLGSEGGTNEFLLPIFTDELVKSGKAKIKVLKTNDSWFGVTFKEDIPAVKESFRELLSNNVYPQNLY